MNYKLLITVKAAQLVANPPNLATPEGYQPTESQNINTAPRAKFLTV